jgi:hypothetical protein
MGLSGAGARYPFLHETAAGRNQLEFIRFFQRRAVSISARFCGYIPLACPNIDEFLFLPVAEGLWKQHELWDGTYTLDDLLDNVELIRVRRENENRAAAAARG